MKFLPLALIFALPITATGAATGPIRTTTEIASPLIRRVQDDCAGDGDRAQECGATNTDRPQNCCDGFECAGRGSVRCVAVGGGTAVDVSDAGQEGGEPAAEVKGDEEPPVEQGEGPEPAPEPAPAPIEDDPNCAKVR